MTVDLHPHRKKTEEVIIKLPSPNVSLSESEALTVPKAEMSLYEKKEVSFSNYVYENLSAWTSGSVARASEEVQEYLKPVTEVVNRYLKTVDINKIDRDLTAYAESTLRSVRDISMSLKDNVDKFLNEQINEFEKQPQDGSLFGIAKRVAISTTGYIEQGFATIIPYVDSLGTKILGEVNYTAFSEAIGSMYIRTLELLKDFFKALSNREKEELPVFEVKFNDKTAADTMDFTQRDANESSKCLEEISNFSKGFFNENKEDFFAHRITDVTEDGIRKEQPDVIRRDLMEDLARAVIDPFPTYENREKDRQEARDKNRIENLGQFARVGIDGELPAIDKLNLLTKSKVVG